MDLHWFLLPRFGTLPLVSKWRLLRDIRAFVCIHADFIADGSTLVTDLEYKERPTEISEHAEGNINKFFEFLSVSETNHLSPWGILERPSVGGVQILCRVDPAACFQLSSPQMDLQWSQLLGAGAVFSHMVPLVLVMAFAQQPQMFAMAVVLKKTRPYRLARRLWS